MNILFWNIKGKSFIRDIVDLIYGQDSDIVILAECSLSTAYIENELRNSYSKKVFYNVPTQNKRLKIFSRTKPQDIVNFDNEFGGNSWTINKFQFSDQKILTIVSVHLPSKIHWNDDSQSHEAINLMYKIREYEKTNTKNTLIIGDFNMNPYESGMVSTLGFHGINDRNRALKEKNRVVLGSKYDYFYNPMWNFLGDEPGPSGTFFYRKAIHKISMWNTFDQVLLRPQLLNSFKLSDVAIIDKIGGRDLIDKKNNIVSNKFSDHLPITLQLNI